MLIDGWDLGNSIRYKKFLFLESYIFSQSRRMRGQGGSTDIKKEHPKDTLKSFKIAGLIPHRVYQQRLQTTKNLRGAKPTDKKAGRKCGRNGIKR